MGTSDWNDEVLLKRASHAGRNLLCLAILVTLFAAALIAGTFLGSQGPSLSYLAGAAAMLAAGYWVLAVAGRRGNPTAPAIVIVALMFQLALGFLLRGINRTNGVETNDIGFMLGMLVCVLIIVALVRSRSVLIALRKRGLWDQAFGQMLPSGRLCLVGGVLFTMGYVGIIGSGVYGGRREAKMRQEDMRQAKAFLDLTRTSEKAFMDACNRLSTDYTQENLDAAFNAVEALEKEFTALKPTLSGAALQQIASTYGLAVLNWKNGLELLRAEEPDVERAQRTLQRGDQFRAEAVQAFDERYVKAPRR